MEKIPVPPPKSCDYLAFTSDKDICKLLDKHEKVMLSDKVEKYSPFGWTQTRKLLITNKYVYNIKNKCKGFCDKYSRLW